MNAVGPVAEPRLRLEGLSKRFHHAGTDEEVDVLQAIDLSVWDGEFVSIVGPSGCGKTTLLHLVAALIQPSAGHVFVDGRPVGAPGPDRAIVFQGSALLPWRTALANVLFGLECLGIPHAEAMDRARASLALVGLESFHRHHPHELSEGMKQRVNLARALAVDPSILLMDEPFASLDDDTREAMHRELLRIWRETRKTVLFVTHQIDEALYLSDRVVVLSHRPGRVLETIAVDAPRPRAGRSRPPSPAGDAYDRVRRLLEPSQQGPDYASGDRR